MMVVRGRARVASIRAVVTRADGSVENLGIVSYWHKNPVKRFCVNLFIRIRDYMNGRSRSK